MTFYKPTRAAWVWGVLILILAACAPAATPTAPPAIPVTPAEQAAPAEPASGAVNASPTQAAAPLPSGSTAEPPTVLPTQPVISNEFTPSDPSQVALAAGRPQLVEFFAFW
jgi:hypothetical protein